MLPDAAPPMATINVVKKLTPADIVIDHLQAAIASIDAHVARRGKVGWTMDERDKLARKLRTAREGLSRSIIAAEWTDCRHVRPRHTEEAVTYVSYCGVEVGGGR